MLPQDQVGEDVAASVGHTDFVVKVPSGFAGDGFAAMGTMVVSACRPAQGKKFCLTRVSDIRMIRP
ncbi:MAG: hypothetical protein ACKV2V_12810 [Blastocatellia bacterium]